METSVVDVWHFHRCAKFLSPTDVTVGFIYSVYSLN